MEYALYYWPEIPGRGEFIRLALEQAGLHYVDVAREPDGVPALLRFLEGKDVVRPPFAPPFLKAGDRIIGQTANILLYLGAHHALAPADEAGRLWTHQLQLTVTDFVAEIHDTHHPIAGELYYHEQKKEAKRRTKNFRDHRLPKYLDYFERVLAVNPHGDHYLSGDGLSYADLSLFQIIAGLHYAFPRTMSRIEGDYPLLVVLHDRVAALPNVAAYLASKRRIPFNEDGIFRHYQELDP